MLLLSTAFVLRSRVELSSGLRVMVRASQGRRAACLLALRVASVRFSAGWTRWRQVCRSFASRRSRRVHVQPPCAMGYAKRQRGRPEEGDAFTPTHVPSHPHERQCGVTAGTPASADVRGTATNRRVRRAPDPLAHGSRSAQHELEYAATRRTGVAATAAQRRRIGVAATAAQVPHTLTNDTSAVLATPALVADATAPVATTALAGAGLASTVITAAQPARLLLTDAALTTVTPASAAVAVVSSFVVRGAS